MNTLSAQQWPAWAPIDSIGQPRWPDAAAQLRARAAVAPAAEVQPGLVAPWAALLRQAGRVAVVLASPQTVRRHWLEQVDGAPLVLAFAATAATTRGDWQRALAALSRIRSPWLRVASGRMPHCAVPQAVELGEVAIALQAGRSRPDERCLRCPAVARCPGPGSSRLVPRPLATPISNQFDLEPAAGPDQTVVQVLGEPPLVIAAGDTPVRQVTQALARGQLYRDRSQQALVDDFAAQLQPMRRARTGVWVPRDATPFVPEEARLLALLRELSGVVVDVGAGPLRYVAALNAALDAGRLRYVAVEPDPQCLRAGQAAVPRGQFVRGVGEALPLADGCADALLFLRSWNHLRDLDAAVRQACRVVRPGGVLIAVDNELFGLVRTAEQLARSRAVDTGSTPFEHYRNASLAQAWRAIERAAPGQWRKLQAWPVGPETSNQWQLVAQRR